MTIPVFYDPHMSANAGSFSPSSSKPLLAIDDWLKHRLDIEFMPAPPATRCTISLAHSPYYVDSVLDLKADNGFGNRSPDVAASLPYTVGSITAAVEHVLAQKRAGIFAPVACSPTSGFHHAHYERGEGFCTFNGLMVAARFALFTKIAETVGILDCDQHYGNGTDEIIDRLGLRKKIRHITVGRQYGHSPAEFTDWDERVHHWFTYPPAVGVLIYQAGADCHVLDPLGGYLTTEQMRKRDRDVFRVCREAGIPLVWNFAGGYQRDDKGTIAPVLELHRNTMLECIKEYAK